MREILANVHEYGTRGYGSGLNGTAGASGSRVNGEAPGRRTDDQREAKLRDDILGKSRANGDAQPANPDDGPPKLTDRGNAIRLARKHGDDLRHVFPWKTWLTWDGLRWRTDDSGAVTLRTKRMIAAMARDAIREMYEIAKAMEEMADDDGNSDEA